MHPDAALASCDAPEEEFDTDEEEEVEPAMPLLSVLPPAATPSARQAAQLPEPDGLLTPAGAHAGALGNPLGKRQRPNDAGNEPPSRHRGEAEANGGGGDGSRCVVALEGNGARAGVVLEGAIPVEAPLRVLRDSSTEQLRVAQPSAAKAPWKPAAPVAAQAVFIPAAVALPIDAGPIDAHTVLAAEAAACALHSASKQRGLAPCGANMTAPTAEPGLGGSEATATAKLGEAGSAVFPAAACDALQRGEGAVRGVGCGVAGGLPAGRAAELSPGEERAPPAQAEPAGEGRPGVDADAHDGDRPALGTSSDATASTNVSRGASCQEATVDVCKEGCDAADGGSTGAAPAVAAASGWREGGGGRALCPAGSACSGEGDGPATDGRRAYCCVCGQQNQDHSCTAPADAAPPELGTVEGPVELVPSRGGRPAGSSLRPMPTLRQQAAQLAAAQAAAAEQQAKAREQQRRGQLGASRAAAGSRSRGRRRAAEMGDGAWEAGAARGAVFRASFGAGEPVVVKGVRTRLRLDWSPAALAAAMARQEERSGERRTGGGENGRSEIAAGEGCGRRSELCLRTALPEHHADLLRALPLGEYLSPDGCLNLASFHDPALPPDLGPRCLCTEGGWEPRLVGSAASPAGAAPVEMEAEGGTAPAAPAAGSAPLPDTCGLRVEESDALHALVHTEEGCQLGGGGGEVEVGGQRILPEHSAVWHIFSAADTQRLAELLPTVLPGAAPSGSLLLDSPAYLSADTLASLERTAGVRPYIVLLAVGDVLLVPAGCAHQVAHLRPCVSVCAGFVAPEHVSHAARLSAQRKLLPPGHRRRADVLGLEGLLLNAACAAALALE